MGRGESFHNAEGWIGEIMNKKTALKLRGMAAQAATNCIPKQIEGNPNERRKFEVNVGGFTYEKLKKLWSSLSSPEKKQLTQKTVDTMARQIAFPPEKVKREPRKKVVKTKNKTKSARRAARKRVT